MTDNITITLAQDEWDTVLHYLGHTADASERLAPAVAEKIVDQIPEEGQAEYDDATQGPAPVASQSQSPFPGGAPGDSEGTYDPNNT